MCYQENIMNTNTLYSLKVEKNRQNYQLDEFYNNHKTFLQEKLLTKEIQNRVGDGLIRLYYEQNPNKKKKFGFLSYYFKQFLTYLQHPF